MAAPEDSAAVPSLPPPRPKSPPVYPDSYRKRRELAKVQMLETEIGFLEEELKSVESLHCASHCCKEITEFTDANSDPFVPTNQTIHCSFGFWKWLCGGSSCFNVSWACCFGCCPRKMPRCCTCTCKLCTCKLCSCKLCSCRCRIPNCHCCSCPKFRCFRISPCRWFCCVFECPSCPDFSCAKRKCCFPKFPNLRRHSCCTEPCCYSCCLCY